MTIGPDRFATQHRLIVTDGEQRQINLNESPLAKLAARSGDKTPLLAHHFAAGERFRRLFERAAIRQRISMSYEPARIADSGNAGPSDQGMTGMNMDARRELDSIFASLPADCVGVIMDVCVVSKRDCSKWRWNVAGHAAAPNWYCGLALSTWHCILA